MARVTLKAARVNAGLTQKEAATIARVHEITIRRWENGESNPDGLQLRGLADIYHVHMDDFILPEPQT